MLTLDQLLILESLFDDSVVYTDKDIKDSILKMRDIDKINKKLNKENSILREKLKKYKSDIDNIRSTQSHNIEKLNDKIYKLSEENESLRKAVDYYKSDIDNYTKDKSYKDKLDDLRICKAQYESLKIEHEKLKDYVGLILKGKIKFDKSQNEHDSIYINWDEYFMAIAQIVKSRSKDPNTKVGACIVKNNRIISTGYNGFPIGINDKEYPWSKGNSDDTKNKYFYVVHAELNAILNARQSVEGSTLYVTLFPCNECAKAIIQSGIKKVVYKEINDSTEDKAIKNSAVFKMLNDAGIEINLYCPGNKIIKIEV